MTVEFIEIIAYSVALLFAVSFIIFHKFLGKLLSRYMYWWHSHIRTVKMVSENITDTYKIQGQEKMEKITGRVILIMSILFLLFIIVVATFNFLD